MAEPWDYLETEAAPDAPIVNNPSGLYCPDCRACGLAHCAQPEYCGGMRRMRPAIDIARLAGPDTPTTEPIAAAPTPEGTNG